MENEKIRVVHIISGLGVGGAETMLYQLIRFRKCENLSYKVISLGRSSYYEDLLDKLDCDVEVYDFTDHPLGSLIRIRKEIKENDIICSWMYAACIIGYFAGKNKAKRIIWCIRHSNLERRLNSRNTNLAINICKHISRKIDVILYNGERSKRRHETIGFKGRESYVLENGCDITDYCFRRDARESIRRELGIQENQLIVGSVSRYATIKDVPTFIKAFAGIKKKNENAVALMCGQGLSMQNESLISLCNENDLIAGEDILLLGFRDDIAKIMSAIDIYVLHSAGEAFPNTLIQAMACERVCIATDVGDVRKILGNPELIVSVGDHEAITEKTISVLESTSEIHNRQNRSRVEDRYDIRRIVDKYEEIYTMSGEYVNPPKESGRFLFRRYKSKINALSAIYSLMPFRVRTFLFEKHRFTIGYIGMGIRYALLKSISKECGDNVAIYPGVYLLHPENIYVGNNVSIHPMSYIDCGTDMNEGGIHIGDDVSIANGVTILSTSHMFYDEHTDIIKYSALDSKRTTIESNVWIGTRAVIIYGTTLKSGCVIGANAVVTKDTVENGVYVGVPAKRIHDRLKKMKAYDNTLCD